MPRVPTYDNFQATPTLQPQTRFDAPEMQATAARQSQETGRSLQQAGGELGQIALDMQNEANKLRVDEATRQAVDLDTDLRAEMLQLEGNHALNRPDKKSLPDEFGSRLNESLDKIESGLGNDAQKAQFRHIRGQIASRLHASATEHMVKQTGVVQENGWVDTETVAIKRGVTLWADEKAVGESTLALASVADERAKKYGWDKSTRDRSYSESVSKMHGGIISSMVDGDRTDLARAYYEANSETMSLGVRERAMNLIETGDFEARTQEAAGTLYEQTGGDAAEALRLAREKFTGKDEDAIVTRIKTMDAETTTLRERAQRDASDKAWSLYADGKRIPASVWAEMDGRDKIAIRKTQRAEAEARLAGTTIKTDPNIYYALTIAAATDPNFKAEDLRRYGDKLSPGDFRHFVNLQAKTVKPEERGAIATITQQKSQTAKAAGLKPEKAAQFFIEADKALGPEAKGMTYEQRQAVLDRLVLPGEVKGGMYDPDMRLFEANQSGRADTFKPEFSDADRRKARAALQKNGVATPSKKQIEDTMKRAYGFAD